MLIGQGGRVAGRIAGSDQDSPSSEALGSQESVELPEGKKWSEGCRAVDNTSNSREGLDWQVKRQEARRPLISLEGAK